MKPGEVTQRLASYAVLDTSATSPDSAWAVPAAMLGYSLDV